MNIITRDYAINNGLLKYFTGEPCKYGHVAERFTKRRQCVECNRIFARTRIAKDPQANRDKVKAWAKQNPEKVKVNGKKGYLKAKQTNHAALLEKKRHWARTSPKMRAITVRYRTSKINRTPKWLTDSDIWMMQEAYDLAALRTKMFGFSWHVDHIIPLQGKTVSGLHVPTNLQVIPAVVNLAKANIF